MLRYLLIYVFICHQVGEEISGNTSLDYEALLMMRAQSPLETRSALANEHFFLTGVKRQAVVKGNELKVFISTRESKCGEYGEDLGRQAWIMLDEKKGALCLTCAELDDILEKWEYGEA